ILASPLPMSLLGFGFSKPCARWRLVGRTSTVLYKDEELWKGYFYAAVLLVSDVITSLTRPNHLYMMFMTKFRAKISSHESCTQIISPHIKRHKERDYYLKHSFGDSNISSTCLNKLNIYQMSQMKSMDQRLKLKSEVLYGLKIRMCRDPIVLN
ncbi:unnamed protein product, partial [Allacma fusca]